MPETAKERSGHLFLIVGLIEIWQGVERQQLRPRTPEGRPTTATPFRARTAIKFSGKKCNNKVKTFTKKKAIIKTTIKKQLNTITAIDSKALEKIQDRIKHRHHQLQRLQNWCMDRISHLSLHQSIEDATALTAEHLELLKSIDQAEMLWIGNNNSSNTHQEMTN